MGGEAYIVVYGGNDTAAGAAVACVVHVASGGRIIFCVDEMVWGTVLPCCCSPKAVGPCCDIGQVGCTGVTQDALAIGLGLGRDKVLRHVGNCLVGESSPAIGAGQTAGEYEKWNNGFHGDC